MKTILHRWVQIIALSVFFALDSHFDRSQAQPLGSWNLVFSSPAQMTSMAYGNGTFIGVGGGLQFISYDGTHWTAYTTSLTINNGSIAYGNGTFLMFGTNNQYKANYILQSTNGTAWTTIYTSSNTLFSAAYGNNTWVFIGTNEIATATLTSSNWKWSEFQPSFSPACISYANGVFAIGCYFGSYFSFFSSPDGITWQYQASLPPYFVYQNTFYYLYHIPFTGIAFGNGVFVATALYSSSQSGYNMPMVFVSSNLVNWVSSLTQTNQSGSPGFFPISFGGNQFVTSCLSFYSIFTSPDGYTWVDNNVNNVAFFPLFINAFTYGQGTFVACYNSSIYQSGVFATQSNSPATTLGISTYPGVTINGTAGAVYQIQYSTDLNTWQTLTNFMLPYSPYLWIDTSSTVTGQRFYQSVQLQ